MQAKNCINFLFTILMVFSLQLISAQSPSPIYETNEVHHPVIGKEGMVASQHYLATEVGISILQKGGNAVDAAVAVGFALAVVLPRAGNIGGGGFMLVHLENEKITKAINYREVAPGKATKNMFLDSNGNVDDQLYNQSYNSIGVPGTVAGLVYALEEYGTMSLKQVIKPAIKLAKEGFKVTHNLAQTIKENKERLSISAPTKAVFLKPNGFYEAGEILKQTDLAWSLKQIAKHGKDAFYKGKIAERIIKDVQKNGGIHSLADFENYSVSVSDPVIGEFRGYQIASMPPPSSGGVHVIQMLNIMDNLGIDTLEQNSADLLHLLVETMRLAYADRSKYLADPNFYKVPVQGLISKEYAHSISQKIDFHKSNKSSDIHPGNPVDYESEETTHFSVADKYGNVVSNTYTLNFSFGTGLMAEGTGILLNNEMGDFAAKTGNADAYGLIGGQLNGVEPNKRPLSSMTPTIVFKDDKPYLLTGSPGGSRIITSVLQTILNVIVYDLNIAEATHSPRVHHQWYPDILYYESSLSPDTRKLLKEKGHVLKQRKAMGSTQSILIKDSLFFGASDPRRPDAQTKAY